MPLYPVFLDLSGKKAVVVGGGRVAERKIFSLLKAGAAVRVISPTLTGRLAARVAKGHLKHTSRAYRKGDLRQAFLVVAATDSAELNARVAEDAPLLCNVVTSKALSNFIVPASVHRGDLTIAISTGGTSPALARSIRQELGELYGPQFGRYLAGLRKQRAAILSKTESGQGRRSRLKALGRREAVDRIRKSLREGTRG